jgi:hypothetical protein
MVYRSPSSITSLARFRLLAMHRTFPLVMRITSVSLGCIASLVFLHLLPPLPFSCTPTTVAFLDLAITAVSSVVLPVYLVPIIDSGLVSFKWALFTWNWCALVIRQLAFSFLLPPRINATGAFSTLILIHCGIWWIMLEILSELVYFFEEPKYPVVKEVVGCVSKVSPSSLSAPKGSCPICMQGLAPANRRSLHGGLAISRLRPRVSVANLREHGTTEILETPCAHKFHLDCVAKWIKSSSQVSKCPVCSRPITKCA